MAVIGGLVFGALATLGLLYGLKLARNSKWADKRRTMQGEERSRNFRLEPTGDDEVIELEQNGGDPIEKIDMGPDTEFEEDVGEPDSD
jgi:hypothetical protein